MPEKRNFMGKARQYILKEAFIFYMYTFFLFILFSVFNIYQRLILDDFSYHSIYYGYALVQALILAKVILISEGMHVGVRYATRPLIYPVIYKSIMLSLIVLVLTVLEHILAGIYAKKNMHDTFLAITMQGWNIIFAKIFLMFTIYIMFFSMLELSKVLGKGKLYELFFTERRAN